MRPQVLLQNPNAFYYPILGSIDYVCVPGCLRSPELGPLQARPVASLTLVCHGEQDNCCLFLDPPLPYNSMNQLLQLVWYRYCWCKACNNLRDAMRCKTDSKYSVPHGRDDTRFKNNLTEGDRQHWDPSWTDRMTDVLPKFRPEQRCGNLKQNKATSFAQKATEKLNHLSHNSRLVCWVCGHGMVDSWSPPPMGRRRQQIFGFLDGHHRL